MAHAGAGIDEGRKRGMAHGLTVLNLRRVALVLPALLGSLMLLTAAIFGMAQSARRPQLDIFKERYDVAVNP